MSFTSAPARSDGPYEAAVARVDAVFRDAGLDGHLHVLDIDSGAEIGERVVVIADQTNVALDLTTHFRKGDVLRQAVYTASVIVDNAGDTK